MNENNEFNASKTKLNSFERRIFPFFNALPHDVPVDWMIPFLYIIEDIQYIPYILSNLTYIRLREWASKIFSIFNPEITNIFFFYSILGVYVILTLYIYTVFFIIYKPMEEKLCQRKVFGYLVQYISYSLDIF
jgi:hypothetical protein